MCTSNAALILKPHRVVLDYRFGPTKVIFTQLLAQNCAVAEFMAKMCMESPMGWVATEIEEEPTL